MKRAIQSKKGFCGKTVKHVNKLCCFLYFVSKHSKEHEIWAKKKKATNSKHKHVRPSSGTTAHQEKKAQIQSKAGPHESVPAYTCQHTEAR